MRLEGLLVRLVGYCFAITVAAMLSGVTARAQDPGMSPPSSQQPMPGGPGGMDSAPTADHGEQGMANMAAAEFVRKILESDVAQVKMSQMAQQKASSDDVKQFGEQMVNVHNKLDEQLGPMAKQLGVSQPKGPTKNDKKELSKLEGLSGAGFDAEYLQAMGSAQQESIKQFDKETKDSMNSAAQQTAKADSPVLEQNYQVLEKIAQAHNVNLQAR